VTDGEKAAYLAAFVDGEGCISAAKIKKTGHYVREIVVVNTDKSLIDAVINICRDLELPTGVYFVKRKPPNNDIWRIRISGGKEVFYRFQQIIPLQSERKKDRLRDLILSYEDRDELTRKRRTGREILCPTCKKMFYESPSLKAQFCSTACAAEGRKRRTTKVCQTCGTSFDVIKAKSKAKFCSLSCSGKAQAQRLSELGKRTIADARRERYKKRQARIVI